ncbi:MAG: tungstate ABC transporter substrate-binding protein WtpA [Anaerolineales bacterium]|nr:tungstate ABC transporter substrate-binding protein WtpA [Anaerolineales bacterium]
MPQKTLRVFCAGSLILPFAKLEKAFEAAYPQVDVQNECHGSIQVIRHVTELHEAIDIVATADTALIPMLMYPTKDPTSGQPYASWHLRFAGNRIALAYTHASRYSEVIKAENWFEIISRPGVKLGLADPRFDAAGYRALMVLTLAEDEYQVQGLHNGLVRSAFTFPVTRFREESWAEITVPEILEPTKNSNIVLRGSSIQLISILESGDLDYAFEYESVIVQHGLLNIPLPDKINLGSPTYQDAYAQVQVKLDFQRFASVQPIFKGEPIGYGITIPSNAPEPELAAQYIAFLLGPEGQAVMEAAHHPLLTPIQCDQPDQIPSLLQAYCPVD